MEHDQLRVTPGFAIGKSAAAVLLVLLMGVGSIAMWLATPVFWLWLASTLAETSQPSASLYVMVLVGIAVTMALIGKGLGTLNRIHARITDRLPRRREQTIWLRSMRGERVVKRQTGVLGVVMPVSVGLALAVFGVWFFLFADPGTPWG